MLVLTEYRRHTLGALPSPSLARQWSWQHAPATAAEPRGVLIAARDELQPLPADLLGLNAATEALRPCVAIARLAAHDLTIIGVYMPYAEGPAKRALWDALNRYAAAHTSDRFVIIGDMNSGTAEEGESGAEYSAQPLEAMWGLTVDACMRAAERGGRPNADRYTWYSPLQRGRRFGRRLDYAFLSPALAPALIDARHDYAVRERGCSDHSDLIVELSASVGLC